jgi:hypothetical protein
MEHRDTIAVGKFYTKTCTLPAVFLCIYFMVTLPALPSLFLDFLLYKSICLQQPLLDFPVDNKSSRSFYHILDCDNYLISS